MTYNRAGEKIITLTIDLSPETEAKINWNAKRQGVSPTDLVRRLVENSPLPEVSRQEVPAEITAEEEGGPTLFDRVAGALQPFWDAEKKGPMTDYAFMEEACDIPEGK